MADLQPKSFISRHEAVVSQRNKNQQLAASLANPAKSVLWLQQTRGNQAVQRMLGSYVMQAKLAVNPPAEPYAQAAGLVADTMRTLDSAASPESQAPIQRLWSSCAVKAKKLQREPATEPEATQDRAQHGDSEDLKMLADTLEKSGKDDIKKILREGRMVNFPRRTSPGSEDNIVDALTEYLLCGKYFYLRHQSDPLFCLISDVTRSSELFKSFRKLVQPVYENEVKSWSGLIQGQTAGLTDLLPDKTKGLEEQDLKKQSDVVLFAMNLYAEASNEVDLVPALKAVAQVVLNRADCAGRTPSEIILMAGQFSWVSRQTDRERAFSPDKTKWVECLKVATQALSTDSVETEAKEATHYYSTAIAPPGWANPKCFVAAIGRHRFYQLDCLSVRCPK
jgi:hypothetical protein